MRFNIKKNVESHPCFINGFFILKREGECKMPADTLLPAKEIIGRKFMLPPPKCGVYFLIQKNKIIYVGSSVDIYGRILSHDKMKKIPFDAFYFIEYDRSVFRAKEIQYIIKLNPKYNSTIQSKNYSQLGLIKFSFIKHLIKKTNQNIQGSNAGMFSLFFKKYSKQNAIQKVDGEGDTAIFLEHEILKAIQEYYGHSEYAYDIFFQLLQETKNNHGKR
jgi:hypothetical protein